jgi:hypothetical protein
VCAVVCVGGGGSNERGGWVGGWGGEGVWMHVCWGGGRMCAATYKDYTPSVGDVVLLVLWGAATRQQPGE